MTTVTARQSNAAQTNAQPIPANAYVPAIAQHAPMNAAKQATIAAGGLDFSIVSPFMR